jgi:N-ethylmaleimide reductase
MTTPFHAQQLFTPVSLGELHLNNRMIMAPLTRSRAGESRIPNDLMAQYYAQRASAGLIISEATAVSAQGYGWPGAPGMYTDAMEQGWAKVTSAVHQAGGKIVLQLWHMGRVVDDTLLAEGQQSVGPSAIAASENIRRASGKPYPLPRALEASEIPGIVADYVQAAERAIRVGFDGVEIHGANGYLIDQFLRDGSNKRTDSYGGSVENRARFLMEVTKAVTDSVGAGRTGLRLSPSNPYNDMHDSDPVGTFSKIATMLNGFNLAYLHLMEPFAKNHMLAAQSEFVTPHIQKIYTGNLIVNGGYDAQSGEAAIIEGGAKAVAYGVPFIANPDLVERYKADAPLNAPRVESFYAGGAEGYTDYPFLTQKAA